MFPVTGEWLPTPYLEAPSGIIGLTVLITYIVGFAVLAYGLGHHLKSIRLPRWLLTIGLCLLAGVAGALGNAYLEEVAVSTRLDGIVNYPMIVPFIGLLLSMLAAIWVNPAAAFLVALSYSIPYSLFQTHQIFDVFPPVFVAVLVAASMHIQMEGRLYKWLRTPVVAGAQGAILQLLLLVFTTFAIVSVSRSAISATNSALLKASSQLFPVFITAVLAGLVISLIRRWIPSIPQDRKPIWLPYSDNLNGRVITTFVLITGLLTFFMIIVAYSLARPTMTRSTVSQIAEQVRIASQRVDDYQAPRIRLLEWASSDIEVITSPENELGDKSHDIELLLNSFESITVLDQDQTILAHFPEDEDFLLNAEEAKAANEVVASGHPALVPVESASTDESMISFIVNGPQDQRQQAIIIGRVFEKDIRIILESLKSDLPGSFAFIRNGAGDFSILPASVTDNPDIDNATDQFFIDESSNSWSDTIVRAFATSEGKYSEFYKEAFGGDWSVGLVVPRDEILASGLNLLGQGVFVFALGLVFAAVMILLIVDSASHVLHQISRQTQRAASLGIESPVKNVGNGDEIGGLAQAFRRLQMAYKQQWEEQRLLLEVVEENATTFDLHKGMPTILDAAVKGVDAAGARIIVARCVDNKILSFSRPVEVEPDVELDQQLIEVMADRTDFICRTEEEVHSSFSSGFGSQQLPQALAMINLKTDDQHQGLICVWKYDSERWTASQLRFLRTLASNASTLITNAKLLATIENGRRRLSAILSSTTDAVLATNESKEVMLLNNAMEQYFGIRSPEVLGRRLDTVLENHDLVEALSGNGSNPARIEVSANDGLVLDGQISTLNYNGGNSAGTVVVLRDVTKFKRLDEMKTDFVSNVSHDLRSPLTQMLTYSQLIPLDGPLTENQTRWLSLVERAVFDMTELIEVLLDLNRLESGIALVIVPFRIEQIFQGIVEDYQLEASSAGITINHVVDESLPVIDGDVDLIRQAIRNIVSNAIKYAPNSGELTLSAETREDDLIICVADNGPGIAESEVTRVFEKFYRTNAQSNGKVTGRGLGLALVKSIAERHGGRAWCESQPNSGCRFYIALPIYPYGRDSI